MAAGVSGTHKYLTCRIGHVSEIKTLIRHCPGCGRRFEIRLISKKPIDFRRETYEDKETVFGRNPLVVEEGIPVTVEEIKFQYTYRCKHCGHQWYEFHTEEEKEE